MSDEIRPDDELAAAEVRLLGLLTLLRSDAVRRDPRLVQTLMRRVRWQSRVRDVLAAVARLAGAVVDGLSLYTRRCGEGDAR